MISPIKSDKRHHPTTSFRTGGITRRDGSSRMPPAEINMMMIGRHMASFTWTGKQRTRHVSLRNLKKGTRRTLRSCRKDSDKQEPVGKREWYIRMEQQIRKKKTLILCVHLLVIHSVKKKKRNNICVCIKTWGNN